MLWVRVPQKWFWLTQRLSGLATEKNRKRYRTVSRNHSWLWRRRYGFDSWRMQHPFLRVYITCLTIICAVWNSLTFKIVWVSVPQIWLDWHRDWASEQRHEVVLAKNITSPHTSLIILQHASWHITSHNTSLIILQHATWHITSPNTSLIILQHAT